MSDVVGQGAVPASDRADERLGDAQKPWLNVLGSRHFLDWLAESQLSLVFTTYQAGKLFFVGRKPDHSISVFERTFERCMGLWASADAQTLWMSSKFQMWRFERAPATAVPHRAPTINGAVEGDDAELPGWTQRGYDFAYVPRVGYTTADIDIHDVAVDSSGRVVFVITHGLVHTLAGASGLSFRGNAELINQRYLRNREDEPR